MESLASAAFLGYGDCEHMTERRLELVIFDCDGILVDSDSISLQIQAEALTELGLPMTFDECFREFAGIGMPRTIEIVEQRLGRPIPKGWEQALQQRVYEAFERELKPVPGIVPALEAIDADVCVASSGTHEKMKLTLGLTGLYDRFEGRIFSSTEVPRAKPAPDLFLHAASELQKQPSNCVVVEDSPAGVEAARAAGMYALAYAATTPASVLQGPNTTVFEDMRELPRLLEHL